MKNPVRFGLVLLLLSTFCLPALAVIIAMGDGAGNTNAPTGDQGWSYVGRIVAGNNAPSSVTYVGNNWFVTAYHIKALDNPSGVFLNGDSYTIIPSSWVRLTNTVSGTSADSVLFKVNENIPLTDLNVLSSQPANGTAVTMIGNGLDRHSTLYTLPLSGPDETYYHIKSGIANTAKRWGTNTIEGDGGLENSGFGLTDTLLTDFDYVSGEAQAATYDSGGGVFVDSGSSWDLAGIIITVSNLYSISGTNAVMLTGGNPGYDGSVTRFADLSAYHTQITNTVAITDIDEDGIPDDWEYEQSGSATGVSASTDQDGDGEIGADEYIADTDPTDSNIVWQANGDFSVTNQTFTFDGSTARKYQLLYTTNDLADPGLTWVSNDVPIWGTGAGTEITVTNTEDTVFYRVWVTLP